MGADSKIEWTDHTFNPWWGCTKVSPGCDHCYAERMAQRQRVGWGPGAPRRAASDAAWVHLDVWQRRADRLGRRFRVFFSMGDPFDNDVPDAWRARLFEKIRATPALDWLLLTKRIGNAAKMVPPGWLTNWPANVWLGISVVDQDEADRDVPKLLALPARVRFLSCEPLLGPIKATAYLRETFDVVPENEVCNPRAGRIAALDWVIVGGESGPGARIFNLAWARAVVAQCAAAGVPCFVKQLGRFPGEQTATSWRRLTLRDPKGGDMSEWPEDLRVRQLPLTEDQERGA